jgi:DNA-directed RNA polymerase subunit RPC12/RpoP
MGDDEFMDEITEYDAATGADTVKCPYCGAIVPGSSLLDNEIECPECGRNFQKD